MFIKTWISKIKIVRGGVDCPQKNKEKTRGLRWNRNNNCFFKKIKSKNKTFSIIIFIFYKIKKNHGKYFIFFLIFFLKFYFFGFFLAKYLDDTHTIFFYESISCLFFMFFWGETHLWFQNEIGSNSILSRILTLISKMKSRCYYSLKITKNSIQWNRPG